MSEAAGEGRAESVSVGSLYGRDGRSLNVQDADCKGIEVLACDLSSRLKA